MQREGLLSDKKVVKEKNNAQMSINKQTSVRLHTPLILAGEKVSD